VSGHTQGRWSVDDFRVNTTDEYCPFGYRYAVLSDRRCVAELRCDPKNAAEVALVRANATLIAAAPAMYEALRDLLAAGVLSGAAHERANSSDSCAICARNIAARDAIARAEGREP
jgi:hypothetical protein